jgi:B12-binding domain/radical SAM domain protein
VKRPDVVLVHPPSIYDFRERSISFGPISDVIPSSPVFEMYPVGFLTLAAYLRRRGYRVRIVNLALLMLRNRRFDAERFLRKLKPRLFGIDLHWLPHAQGGAAVAAILKRLHPEIPIVFGGISATYFHEELIRDPAVDFVLRGSVTEPALLALVQSLESGGHAAALGRVPGLTWKSDGEVHVNPAIPSPLCLDDFDFDLGSMIRDVVTHLDFWTTIPFRTFWQHPITAVFTVRGCAHGCVTCGASRSSFRRFMPGTHPIFRTPAAIARTVRDLASFTRAPIFVVGDLRDGGAEYAQSVLDALASLPVSNRIIFEFFGPPCGSFVDAIERAIAHWGTEISPESHDPAIRARLGKSHFTNEELEASIDHMLAHRCEQLDLFYMTGLPGQTYENVMETVDSIEALFRRFDARLGAFITPMAPFLDPGSDGFEQPERHGYRLFARTLAEHRALLEQNDWSRMLNYETEWMTREEIARATCDASTRLEVVKRGHGHTTELFPAASFLRNFRIAGILRFLAKGLSLPRFRERDNSMAISSWRIRE